MRCRENRVSLDTTQQVYLDAVRDFLKTKGIDQPRSEDRQHPSRRFRRGWRGRSVNQLDKLFQKGRKRANAIACRQLFDGVVASSGRRKSGNTVDRRRILSQGLPEGRSKTKGRFDAPNSYKVIAVLDLNGDGKMEVVIGSHYYEGEMTTIYQMRARIKQRAVLSAGCGA